MLRVRLSATLALLLLPTLAVSCGGDEEPTHGTTGIAPGAGGMTGAGVVLPVTGVFANADAGAPVVDAGSVTSGSGSPAGGSNVGGSTAGGSTAGGSPGGTTAGGTAAGGTAAGGFTGGFTGGAGGFFAGGFTGGSTGGAGGFFAGGFTGGGAAGGGTPAIPLDPSVKQPEASKLPKVSGTCPDLSRDGTVTVAGAKVQIWVGSKPGPVYVYFHGTGTAPGEVNQGLPGATSGVKTNGGIVASWDTSNNEGSNTGTIWYTGDLKGIDQIVACGVEKGIVDTGRIHVAGFSAGGLETGAALFGRSNYVASGIVYSGGKPFGVGALQDPSNVPAVLGAHGAKGQDSLGLDFHDGTIAIENEIKKLGGFAMDCDDGKDHVGGWFTRAGVGGKAMQFLKDHPYNTKPSPYASMLPSGYPANCKIVQ